LTGIRGFVKALFDQESRWNSVPPTKLIVVFTNFEFCSELKTSGSCAAIFRAKTKHQRIVEIATMATDVTSCWKNTNGTKSKCLITQLRLIVGFMLSRISIKPGNHKILGTGTK
jgi:hypothetical protein